MKSSLKHCLSNSLEGLDLKILSKLEQTIVYQTVEIVYGEHFSLCPKNTGNRSKINIKLYKSYAQKFAIFKPVITDQVRH